MKIAAPGIAAVLVLLAWADTTPRTPPQMALQRAELPQGPISVVTFTAAPSSTVVCAPYGVGQFVITTTASSTSSSVSFTATSGTTVFMGTPP